MYCNNCGARNLDDAKFCGECGKPILVNHHDVPSSNQIKNSANKPKNRKAQFVFFGILGLVTIFLVGYLLLLQFFPDLSKNPFEWTNSRTNRRGQAEIIQATTPVNLLPTSTLQPSLTPRPADTPTKISKPSPSPTPEIKIESLLPAEYKCPDKNQLELRIGIFGKVRKVDVNLRRDPIVPMDYDSNVIRVLREGDRVKVLDGPRCAHDGSWWKVLTESSDVGWVRELQPSKGRLIIKTDSSSIP